MLTLVPEGTSYVMVYLQSRDGVGRVWFDDVELVVKSPPMPRVPAPRIALLTDLPDTNAVTAHPDNEMRALALQRIVNGHLRGRHLLRQSDEEEASQYVLDRILSDNARPVLQNTSARDKFGLLIELTARYGDSYGTVLQTDVTCELCRALFLAYPPPATWPQ